VRKRFSIITAAVVLVAALIAALTWPGEAQQRASRAQDAVAVAPISAFDSPQYTAGMRIIHVPQAGETVAGVPAQMDDVGTTADETVDSAPQTRSRNRSAISAGPHPRRILPPPSSGPKRTVLNAPAPGSLSPIYPTPRWKLDDKFTSPAPVERVVAPAPPDTVPADENSPPD
jgi:hypothetical protein